MLPLCGFADIIPGVCTVRAAKPCLHTTVRYDVAMLVKGTLILYRRRIYEP